MTICFFGNYIEDYPRLQVLRKGLKANGVSVLECHTNKRGFRKYWDLYRQHAQLTNQYDVLLVGMAGYSLVWFAKLLTRKKIVFDAFVSIYLTETEDRKTISRFGLSARYLSFLEKFCFNLADIILFDTQAQIDYVTSEYQLPKDKFQRIFVGSDDEVFHPSLRRSSGAPSPAGGEGNNEKFIVHWHGHIVPFHGLETVLEAAEKLKDNPAIQFQIVTRFGKRSESFREIVKERALQNVQFFPETSYEGLAKFMSAADVCLGVFGKNLKTDLVIPNKIFEAAACGKPIISAKSKALGELFSQEKNIIMTEPGDAHELAQKILLLKDNPEVRQEMGKKAFDLFKERLSPQILGEKLKNVLLQRN